jgi:hypothetical protein
MLSIIVINSSYFVSNFSFRNHSNVFKSLIGLNFFFRAKRFWQKFDDLSRMHLKQKITHWNKTNFQILFHVWKKKLINNRKINLISLKILINKYEENIIVTNKWTKNLNFNNWWNIPHIYIYKPMICE